MPGKILDLIKSHVIGLAFTAVIFFSSCSTLNIFPVSQDLALGEQVSTEIQKNPKDYPLLNNAGATKYLQDIVNTILMSNLIEYKNTFSYRVKIINDDKVVNAFCTPGGFIYVYTGLLKFIDNDATLAGVLAHEIAHAERRHSTQRMTKAYGAQVLLELALGNNPNQTEQMAGNLFTGLALLKNSRDDEYESDEYSFKYLYSTKKWYPGAIKFFFEKVMDKPDALGLKTLLSTHPLGPDRTAAINKFLKENNVPPPTEANLGSRTYKEFLKQLK